MQRLHILILKFPDLYENFIFRVSLKKNHLSKDFLDKLGTQWGQRLREFELELGIQLTCKKCPICNIFSVFISYNFRFTRTYNGALQRFWLYFGTLNWESTAVTIAVSNQETWHYALVWILWQYRLWSLKWGIQNPIDFCKKYKVFQRIL